MISSFTFSGGTIHRPDDVTLSPGSGGVRGYPLDPTNAEALWKRSEELVGESF
jgi:hypothetical protein